MTLREELLVLERGLLEKQKEIVKLLTDMNERDVKINYLHRENLKMTHLLGSYKSVLRKAREEKKIEMGKETNLTKQIDQVKYSEDKTEKKVEQVVRITKKGQTDTKVLVDSEKNEYILSLPNQASSQAIDETLLIDIGILVIASAVSGVIASALGQPILLGYLIGGSLIGPGCFGLIQQFVQVETLAQLGATFLLFGLGVEFSVTNLVRCWRVAIIGGIMQILFVISMSSLLGYLFAGLPPTSGAFLGSVLAMSSTTMVIKGLMETNEMNTPSGQVQVGILVMQDIALAVMLSVLPVMSSSGSIQSMVLILGGKILGMSLVVIVSRKIWPLSLAILQQRKSHDLLLLGVVSLCVVMTMITEEVLNSAEVGAFIAGMLINTAPKDLATKALHLFEPVRDIFSALFFSSIGMVINPSFLMSEAQSIAIMVGGTLVLKGLVLTPIILYLGADLGVDLEVSASGAVALANIGEFAFVLANEGFNLGFLDRQTYKVLLGSAAVSLLLSPVVNSGLQRIIKSWLGSSRRRSASDGSSSAMMKKTSSSTEDGKHDARVVGAGAGATSNGDPKHEA